MWLDSAFFGSAFMTNGLRQLDHSSRWSSALVQLSAHNKIDRQSPVPFRLLICGCIH